MEIIIKDITVEELRELFSLQKEEKPKTKVKYKPYSKPYIRYFDERSTAWCKNSEMNKMFLLQQQNHANDILRRRGYLFLNEVYNMLGLSLRRNGQCVGWVYDVDNPWGDNYVDFGIFSGLNLDTVNGLRETVLLEFNVDGNILDRLEEEP